MLKGWKTLIYGAAVAVLPALLSFLGGIDMTALGLNPGIAAAIGAGIIGLRAYTSTPIMRTTP